MPSSVISKISYDPASSTLRITFVSGSIYDYQNVPLNIYQSIKQAPSKGIYFNQFVKGTYPFIKIR